MSGHGLHCNTEQILEAATQAPLQRVIKTLSLDGAYSSLNEWMRPRRFWHRFDFINIKDI